MKTFEEFCNENSFEQLNINNKLWTLTKSKSNSAWNDRIKTRTGLTNEMFFKKISKGIEKAYEKYPELDEVENVCLRFLISKFVLIINTKNNIIVTVRDAEWDNLDNGKCDGSKFVVESLKRFNNYTQDTESLESFIKDIDTVNDGYEILVSYEGEETLVFEFKDKCDFCVEVEL